MNIVKSTDRFEAWLGENIRLIKPDLNLKHRRMTEAPFPFLRATFYRWMQLWPELCPELVRAPHLPAVGDLHVENFGTWRDIEGRLVWGINDFDEAAALPYALDLVRLATSAALAAEYEGFDLKFSDACHSILEGYRESLEEGGRPFVLEENNSWLREIATGELRDPPHFWQKIGSLPRIKAEVPASARAALDRLMPERDLNQSYRRRIAGLGSLGHMRIVAVAEYHGGRIAREAKTLAPSSAYWAGHEKGPVEFIYSAILSRAVRCPDPFVQVQGTWVVRRLSPHCCRIELDVMPANRDHLRLLSAMGWETANIHLGAQNASSKVLRDLKRRKPQWLFTAAKEMIKAIKADWKNWKKSAGK